MSLYILIKAGQALQNVLQEALALQEGTEIHERLPTVMMPRKIWWDMNCNEPKRATMT
jgi:hypothetical protein